MKWKPKEGPAAWIAAAAGLVLVFLTYLLLVLGASDKNGPIEQLATSTPPVSTATTSTNSGGPGAQDTTSTGEPQLPEREALEIDNDGSGEFFRGAVTVTLSSTFLSGRSSESTVSRTTVTTTARRCVFRNLQQGSRVTVTRPNGTRYVVDLLTNLAYGMTVRLTVIKGPPGALSPCTEQR